MKGSIKAPEIARTFPSEHNVIAQAPGYKAQGQLLKSSLFKKEKEKVLDFALVRQ